MGDCTKKTKIVYLEILRVIALFCIMFNHSGARGDSLYAYTDSGFFFAISLLMAIICRMGVPIFFMITGALLIIREEDARCVYTKRIPRMLLVLLIFTTIRYLYEVFIIQEETFNILNLFKYLVNGKLFMPYWFLYAYISLLIVLPIISKGLVHLAATDFKWMFLAEIILRIIIPTISTLGIVDFEFQFLFVENIEFVMWGYYFECVMPQKRFNRRGMLIAVLIFVLSVIGMLAFSIANGQLHGSETKVYSELYKLPLSVASFYFVKTLFVLRPIKSVKISNTIIYLGSLVFGIYLIEDYLRNAFAFICDFLANHIYPIPACAVWLLCVFITGEIIITILKKIPFIKKLV